MQNSAVTKKNACTVCTVSEKIKYIQTSEHRAKQCTVYMHIFGSCVMRDIWTMDNVKGCEKDVYCSRMYIRAFLLSHIYIC